ncbi:MAG TPA: FecR family protein [Pyrinomonadaceae bacterium]|nr:FecR family protein [Pyrinomonadaceae bacterium]
MRTTLNVQRLAVFSAFLLVALGINAIGQTREDAVRQARARYVISAKAGGINAVSGQATVHGRGESEWQQLMVTDDLNSGDRVRTETDGRVEILLNPGSYLRVGGDSEVELADNSLDNLEVRLLRGVAIVEATGGDGIELNINISTPHTKLAIVRHGLYRLSVTPSDNTTELIVRKGRVLFGSAQTKVKAGNKVVFNGANVSVAKLTDQEKKKKNRDEMDLWSADRAKSLAEANRRITDRMMTSAFSSWRGFGWSFRSAGLWFYNPRSFCYTFLPYGYGWGSPYGSSYTTSIYYHPRITYRPTPGGWTTPSTGTGPTVTTGSTPSYPGPSSSYPTLGPTGRNPSSSSPSDSPRPTRSSDDFGPRGPRRPHD